MTPKQLGFIATLAAERTLPENTRGTYIRNLVAGIATQPNAAQASKMIEWLLELPKATVETDGVAEGRYAVISEAGITEFFKVDAPSEGKWAGYVFVKQQASDDLFPVKGARKADILARIAADPDALARYGQELGVCGRCGRTLTDEVSRAMGIGPECAKIVGAIRPSVEEVVAPAATPPAPVPPTERTRRRGLRRRSLDQQTGLHGPHARRHAHAGLARAQGGGQGAAGRGRRARLDASPLLAEAAPPRLDLGGHLRQLGEGGRFGAPRSTNRRKHHVHDGAVR